MADLAEFDVPENGEDAAEGGISRRALVKAGAATAWTVPLIQVIAAAPAHAATSGGVAMLTVTGSGAYSDGGSTLTVSLTITNSTNFPTQNLQVTLTFPNGWAPSPAVVSAGSWTSSRQGSTWTFTATSQLGQGSTPLTASFTIKQIDRGKQVEITGAATSTGSAPAPIDIQVSGT